MTSTTRARRDSRAERIFREYLPIADSIADGFSRKGGGLIERDDARQVARMALWLASQRAEDPASLPAYLSRHVRGALLHHARDLGRAIRVPRRAQETGGHGIPWRLDSLDLPAAPGASITLGEALPAPAPAEPAAAMPGSERLSLWLDRLPEPERQAVELIWLQGIGPREAAAAIGCNRNTAADRARRGLANLQAMAGGRQP